MTTVRNKTRKPLRVPLPGGKVLHLGPGKSGQVADDAVDRPAFKKLVDAASKLPDQYGAFVAAEQVRRKQVGNDLVLLTYLYKAERYPVVWRFAFYRPRPSDKWTVVSLRFDSKLLDLEGEPE